MKLAVRLCALVVVLGGAALLWWRDRDGPPSVAVEPAPSAARETSAPAEASELAAVREIDAREPSATPHYLDPATPDAQPIETALLKVKTVGTDRGEAMAEERVLVFIDGRGVTKQNVASSRAKLGEAPQTDLAGRAELDVPCGVPLRVRTASWRGDELDVPALRPGEVRDIVLVLRTQFDRTVWGRLVDDATDRPIAGAVFKLGVAGYTTGPPVAVSDDEGSFSLRVRAVVHDFATVLASGYASEVFALEAEHETPEQAVEIRMQRGAVLTVLVYQGSRRVADASVEISTPISGSRQERNSTSAFRLTEYWAHKTDASGTAEFVDLPPDAPLSISVRELGARMSASLPNVTLASGERRQLGVAMGAGATIVGRIEDTARRPVPNCELWLVGASDSAARWLNDRTDGAQRGTSDAEGVFRFENVAPGTWLVGPREEKSPGDERTRNPLAAAAFAQPVTIEPDAREVELTIRADRGLYVAGVVFGPSGAPAADCGVHVSLDSAQLFMSRATDEAGRFVFGPLPAAMYALSAGGFGSAYAPTPRQAVDPHDGTITLRVEAGATIHARVVGSDDTSRCRLLLTNRDDEQGSRCFATFDDTITFGGLSAGTYGLAASNDRGWFGCRSVSVRAGESLEDVEIALEPGAKLSLHYTGTDDAVGYALYFDGVYLASDEVRRGLHKIEPTSKGSVEVRWRALAGGATRTEHVDVAAGETRELGWDGEP